ncbi:Y+l amino acid transporter 1, partial [Plakobranchus ocellatus]
MVTVISVYLVTNISYLAILTPTQMLQSTAVAVTFAEQTISNAFQWLVPVLISISVCGTANGIALSMS